MARIGEYNRVSLVNLMSTRLREAVSNPVVLNQDYKKLSVTKAIDNEDDILMGIANRLTTLKDIDPEESSETATKRERKLITYEINWKAQDDASIGHRKTVHLVASEIRKYGIQPKHSVIDLFAERDNIIFIFEIKSIHTDNFIHQTRTAIGQLLDYEYFQIRSRFENKGKTILKGIVYSKEPPKEIIEFLKTYHFEVFWREKGVLTGDLESNGVLKKFLGK